MKKSAVDRLIVSVLPFMFVRLAGGFISGGAVSGLSWRWWTASAGPGRTWPGWRDLPARQKPSDATPSPERETDRQRRSDGSGVGIEEDVQNTE